MREYLDVPLPGGRDAPRNTRVASCGAGERPGPTPLLKITTISSMFSNFEKRNFGGVDANVTFGETVDANVSFGNK